MRVVAAWLQLLLTCIGLFVALTYVASRTATDRLLVTQYLFWTPSVVYVATLAGTTVLAWIAGLGARPPRASQPTIVHDANHGHHTPKSWVNPSRPLRLRLTQACLACFLIGVFHVAWFECKVYRFVVGRAATSEKSTDSIVVVHWNMTYVEPPRWGEYVSALVQATTKPTPPDVVVVSNPTWGRDLDALSAALGPDYHTVRVGVFAIATRFRVLRVGASSLHLPGFDGKGALLDSKNQPDLTSGELLPSWSPIPRVGGSVRDPGNIMFIELDTASVLGRNIVLWAIDLPSDIRLSRYTMAKLAARQIETLKNTPDRGRFPEPDMVVGDFNTPRGSASLSLLTPGMTHAYEQAGRGYAASWPREHRGPKGQRFPNRYPVFHIDHSFVTRDFRAAQYHLLDPGIGEHLLQRVVVKASN